MCWSENDSEQNQAFRANVFFVLPSLPVQTERVEESWEALHNQ